MEQLQVQQLKREPVEIPMTEDHEIGITLIKQETGITSMEHSGFLQTAENVEEPSENLVISESVPILNEPEQAVITSATDTDSHYVIVSAENNMIPDPKIINAVTVEAIDACTSDGEGLQQPARYIRLQGDNGQTYMLAIAPDSESNQTVLPSQFKEATTTDNDIKSPDRKSSKSSKSKEDITQAWFTTRDDKNSLQNNGHTWKQGQWTKEEIELLKQNIDCYCSERDIQDATEIIFQMSKDERKDFYRTIAKGLDRPLFSVYRRVTRMYDQKNHVGRYSLEDMAKLRELRARYGNDWTTIGTALGRSASSVKDKCRLMKDKCNSGKWLVEEETRLTSAVYKLAKKKPGEKVTSGLSWASVAEKVGSRSEKQCRTKWLNYLNWKEVGGTEWTRQDDISLIMQLSELNVDSEAQIVWADLAQGWPSARSPQWLRGKWWSLKRHVKGYKNMTFIEVVNYLKSIYLQIKHVGGNNENDLDVIKSITLQSASLDCGAAVEILHGWSPGDGAGSIVITNPNTSASGFTLTGASLQSDHIVVHSLPLHSDKSDDGVSENVHQQIIVSTDSTDDDCVVGQGSYASIITQSLELPTGLKAEQDLNSLSQQNTDLDCDNGLDGGVVKYEVLSSSVNFDSQTVTDSGLPSAGVQSDIEHSVQSDIVPSEGESSNLEW